MVTISERGGFLSSWLRAQGVPAAEIPGRMTAARARAARFPGLAGRGYPVLEALAGRLGPALLLGTPRRAGRLAPADLERLEEAFLRHPLAPVRLAHVLLKHPAFEDLYPDAASPPTSVHPLETLAPRIRESTSFRRTYDVVVIGSGAGGAPVAWDLARRGLSVAVVEAGGLLRTASTADALERHYLDQGMVGSVAGGGLSLVLAGRAVGGTTVVNSGTSLRPPQERLAAWDALVGTRFGEGELDPWLEQASRQIGVGESRRDLLDASAAVIERGLIALGRGDGVYVLPRNAPDC